MFHRKWTFCDSTFGSFPVVAMIVDYEMRSIDIIILPLKLLKKRFSFQNSNNINEPAHWYCKCSSFLNKSLFIGNKGNKNIGEKQFPPKRYRAIDFDRLQGSPIFEVSMVIDIIFYLFRTWWNLIKHFIYGIEPSKVFRWYRRKSIDSYRWFGVLDRSIVPVCSM